MDSLGIGSLARLLLIYLWGELTEKVFFCQCKTAINSLVSSSLKSFYSHVLLGVLLCQDFCIIWKSCCVESLFETHWSSAENCVFVAQEESNDKCLNHGDIRLAKFGGQLFHSLGKAVYGFGILLL